MVNKLNVKKSTNLTTGTTIKFKKWQNLWMLKQNASDSFVTYGATQMRSDWLIETITTEPKTSLQVRHKTRVLIGQKNIAAQVKNDFNITASNSTENVTHQVLECAVQPFVDTPVPATTSTFAGMSRAQTSACSMALGCEAGRSKCLGFGQALAAQRPLAECCTFSVRC